MAVWRDWREEFLDETLRRHGLGSAFQNPQCTTCGKVLRTAGTAPITTSSEGAGDMAAPEAAADTTERCVETVEELYRCRVCGEWKECGACCLQRHQRTPLHRMEVSDTLT